MIDLSTFQYIRISLGWLDSLFQISYDGSVPFLVNGRSYSEHFKDATKLKSIECSECSHGQGWENLWSSLHVNKK